MIAPQSPLNHVVHLKIIVIKSANGHSLNNSFIIVSAISKQSRPRQVRSGKPVPKTANLYHASKLLRPWTTSRVSECPPLMAYDHTHILQSFHTYKCGQRVSGKQRLPLTISHQFLELANLTQQSMFSSSLEVYRGALSDIPSHEFVRSCRFLEPESHYSCWDTQPSLRIIGSCGAACSSAYRCFVLRSLSRSSLWVLNAVLRGISIISLSFT